MNRFYNPAETQFINTYAPIPFDQLSAVGKQYEASAAKRRSGYKPADWGNNIVTSPDYIQGLSNWQMGEQAAYSNLVNSIGTGDETAVQLAEQQHRDYLQGRLYNESIQTEFANYQKQRDQLISKPRTGYFLDKAERQLANFQFGQNWERPQLDQAPDIIKEAQDRASVVDEILYQKLQNPMDSAYWGMRTDPKAFEGIAQRLAMQYGSNPEYVKALAYESGLGQWDENTGEFRTVFEDANGNVDLNMFSSYINDALYQYTQQFSTLRRPAEKEGAGAKTGSQFRPLTEFGAGSAVPVRRSDQLTNLITEGIESQLTSAISAGLDARSQSGRGGLTPTAGSTYPMPSDMSIMREPERNKFIKINSTLGDISSNIERATKALSGTQLSREYALAAPLKKDGMAIKADYDTGGKQLEASSYLTDYNIGQALGVAIPEQLAGSVTSPDIWLSDQQGNMRPFMKRDIGRILDLKNIDEYDVIEVNRKGGGESRLSGKDKNKALVSVTAEYQQAGKLNEAIENTGSYVKMGNGDLGVQVLLRADDGTGYRITKRAQGSAQTVWKGINKASSQLAELTNPGGKDADVESVLAKLSRPENWEVPNFNTRGATQELAVPNQDGSTDIHKLYVRYSPLIEQGTSYPIGPVIYAVSKNNKTGQESIRVVDQMELTELWASYMQTHYDLGPTKTISPEADRLIQE